MKDVCKGIILLMSMVLTHITMAATDSNGLWLGNAKQPVTTIYYANGNTAAAGAARELDSYLERIIGRKMTLVPVTAARLTGREQGIFIGRELTPQEFQPTTVTPESEWYAVRVVDGRIYLWGNDMKQSQGTFWAVEDVLRRECGVRWLWPGNLGEVVPASPGLRIPVQQRLETPAFQIRSPISFGYQTYNSDKEKAELDAFCRQMRLGRSIFGYRGTSGFNHYFSYYLDPMKYRTVHPEYYSLVSPVNWIGGVKPTEPARSGLPGTSWQLCTSNPEVRRIIATEIIKTNTPDIMSISPEDGFAFCECENCRKLDPVRWKDIFNNPDLSNRIYDFVNDVATQVKKENPKSRIGIFSYSFFQNPPTTVHSLPDNVYISMTYSAGEMPLPGQREEFEKRLTAFNRLGVKFVGREYWGTHYYLNMPWLHTRLIDWNIKTIHRYGAVGVYGEAGKDWANNALNYYLLAELMWNPSASRESVIDDFCLSAFGAGAKTMRGYFEFMETQVQNWNSRNADGNASYNRRLNGFAEMFSPVVLAKANEMLRLARKQAATEEQKKRVEFFQSGLRYTETMVRMISAYRDAAAVGTGLIHFIPAPGINEIDDESIAKILTRAEDAGRARERILAAQHGTHSTDIGLMLFANATPYRPWLRVVQDQAQALAKGEYNYLVNGAFENDLFGWNVKGVAAVIDMNDNHDDIHNQMAMYHANQGKSLKLQLRPGEHTELTSAVKVGVKPESRWLVSGWINHGASENQTAQIIWNTDGKEVVTRLEPIPYGWTDSKGWREFAFAPVSAPQGQKVTAILRLTVNNTGTKDAVVKLDDLKLRKCR